MPGECAAARRPSWLTWVLPDLGLAVSFLTLFYCLVVYDGSRKLFRDSDSGWHIRTGEAILAGSGFPRTDPYSFSRGGEPWFAWEWGADVAMGAVHQAAGLGGVTILYATAIAAATLLWFRLNWAAGGAFLPACVLASPMLSTVNLHWLARPHVFGWLFLLAAVLYLETAAERGSLARRAPLVILFSALWANVHASFFLGPALALLYAACSLAGPLLWTMDAAAARRRARRLASLAVLSALAGLLNPYGWNLHRHLFAYLSNHDLLQRVAEFQTFNLHTEGALQILAGVGVAAAGAVLAFAQRRLSHAVLSAILVAVALRSARGLPVAALVVLPLANGAITGALRTWSGLRPGVRRALDGFLAYSDRLRVLDSGLKGWAAVPVVLALAVLWARSPAVAARTGFPPDEFPVAAASRIENLPESARLLAPDKFGGYLIYRFAGRRKVFFDGRSDFYGSGFMKQYIRLVEVRPGWQDQVRSWGFTHALLPNDYPLLAALEQAGWRPLWRDPTATLLEGN